MRQVIDLRLESKIKTFLYDYVALYELEKDFDYPILRAIFNRIVEHVIHKITERTPPEQLYMILDLAMKIKLEQLSQEQIEKIVKCVESNL